MNSATGSNNNNQSWTPPLWLSSSSGGGVAGDQKQVSSSRGSGGSKQQHPLFCIAVPTVPQRTYHAVARQIRKTSNSQQSAEQQQIRKLALALQEQRRKAAAAQEMVQQLQQHKTQGLEDIRVQREQEASKIVAAMERRLRDEYEEQAKERKLVWKRKIEEECDNERKRLRKEAKEEEKEPTKQAKKPHEEAKLPAKEQEQPKATAESNVIRDHLAELQKEVECLEKNRTEMIWLLKQVIKAEEKQKAKLLGDKKPEPKIHISKQA